MTFTEFGDWASKLGPVCVAFAVYLNSRQQTRWQKHSAKHASRLEIYKLNVSMFPARQKAYELVSESQNGYVLHGEVTRDDINKAVEASNSINLLFDENVSSEMRGLIKAMILVKRSETRVKALSTLPENHQNYLAALDESDKHQDDMVTTFWNITNTIKEELRLGSVAPLADDFHSSWRSWTPDFSASLAGLVRLTTERR